ncbi:MAG TPA: hypothetical protein VF206_01690 [Rubrobacter sp.]
MRPPSERPSVPWDRLILRESNAAAFLKMPASTFRKKAAAGEFERHPLTDGTHAYYVYDLLDWFLSR